MQRVLHAVSERYIYSVCCRWFQIKRSRLAQCVDSSQLVQQVRPTEALSNHHYLCTCTKELWILLMHLLEHRSKTLHTQVNEHSSGQHIMSLLTAETSCLHILTFCVFCK